MSDTILTLNHPWKIYLREPVSSYTKYSVYHRELVRLLQFVKSLNEYIINLKENQAQLTNFIIGTPMEDAIHKRNCSSVYSFQWQQLFPYHITNFIKHFKKLDNDININIIIISPDDVFMDDTYKEPLFMTHCCDYAFTKIKNREYIYSEEKLAIKINIFTCPFPQLETNKSIIQKSNVIIEKIGTFELDTLAPSENDIEFIDTFYSYIDSIASNPQSNMIINSYATFRNVREYDNYGLFPSLLELANKYKIIATEWEFSENNYLTRIASKINFTADYIKYRVSYLNPNHYDFVFKYYENVSLMEIKKNYSDIAMGKILICLLIKFPHNKLVLRKIEKYINF